MGEEGLEEGAREDARIRIQEGWAQFQSRILPLRQVEQGAHPHLEFREHQGVGHEVHPILPEQGQFLFDPRLLAHDEDGNLHGPWHLAQGLDELGQGPGNRGGIEDCASGPGVPGHRWAR